ncbi:MAG TPA: hypothetical protein VL689_02050 [Paraburkholderia sp.]|jgi:hypothetical protein|nr:hypothetical protein [Paraburkholderia sp.]
MADCKAYSKGTRRQFGWFDRRWKLGVCACVAPLLAACGGGNGNSGGTPELGGDPLFAYQWYLLNVGQDVFTGAPGTPGIDLHVAGPLNDGINGEGVNVMVVDTGSKSLIRTWRIASIR